MKFIREIPEKMITQSTVDNLTNYGFILVYTQDSIEVWVEDNEFWNLIIRDWHIRTTSHDTWRLEDGHKT